MDRYFAALEDARNRHFSPSAPSNLRAHLIAALEQEKKLFGPIPPAKRDKFKRWIIEFGMKLFVKGFNRRYLELGSQAIEVGLSEEAGVLRRAMGNALREWDLHVRNIGRVSTLKDSYPKDLFYSRMGHDFRASYYAGAREGYRARRRRIAADMSAGVVLQESQDVIARIASAVLREETSSGAVV